MADEFLSRLYAADRVKFGSKPVVPPEQGGPAPDESSPEAKDLASKNYDAYVRSRDNGHADWVKIARKCDAYFSGDQWEDTVTRQLDAEGRPHVTINQVLSTVNSILSEHVRTRQEISYSPRGHGATEDVAKALAFVTKQIQYNNRSAWVEQQVVADGLIEDRGYFDIRIDFSDNIFGEIREIAVNPRDVLLDPGANEYDPATWKEVIRTRWLTPDEVSVFYGKKAGDAVRMRTSSHRLSADTLEFEESPPVFGELGDQLTFVMSDEDMRQVKRVRMVERQWRKYTRCKYFVDPVEGDMRKVPTGWDDMRAAVHAATFGLEMYEKPELRIRWTVSADDVLLYDDWSLYNRFTLIPFFPYFRRGKPTGLVRHLLSPQDMLNKITSQELHVVNTTANSGWIFESGSLVNMTADDLELIGSKTGLVLEFKKGSDIPTKIQPNQIPSGLDHIATKSQIYFRNVSGLPETFVSGQSTREVSGVAIDKMNQSGAGSLDVVWDNLAKTRQMRAEMYLDLLQQWYTERRLIQVTELDEDGREQTQSMYINDPENPDAPMTPEAAILNDLSLGEYAVVTISMPNRESTQDTEFAQVMEMRNAGIMIPDWVAIEASRLSNKKEISEVVKKIQGMADPTPEEIEMQEMMRTLELQTMEANLRDLLAASMLKEAQAELAVAKAEGVSQTILADLQKEGARQRTELEKIHAAVQQSLHEQQVRLAVSREKSDTSRYQAQVASLTKRTETIANRQTKLADIAARTREAQARARSPKKSAK